MTVPELVGMLGGRMTGPNRGMARCPAHEDRRDSLSASVGRNGGVVVYCFAGCCTSDILKASGLKWNALFANGPPPSPEERAKAGREKAAKEAAQEQQRQRERAVCSREQKLEAVASELAGRLARLPDGAPEADAMARLLHDVLGRLPERQIDDAELCSGTDLKERGPVGIGASEDCLEY